MKREGRGNQRIVLESSWPRSLLHFLAVTFLCFRNAERRSKFLTAEPFPSCRTFLFSSFLMNLRAGNIGKISVPLDGQHNSFMNSPVQRNRNLSGITLRIKHLAAYGRELSSIWITSIFFLVNLSSF